MANKYQRIPNIEGIYKVGRQRALMFVYPDGSHKLWARQDEHVDLRSPYLMEHVQVTGQLHKLTRAEEPLPDGVAVVGSDHAPEHIRRGMDEYHGRANTVDLPEVAVAELPDVKPAPAPKPKTQPAPEPPPAPEAPPEPNSGQSAEGEPTSGDLPGMQSPGTRKERRGTRKD